MDKKITVLVTITFLFLTGCTGLVGGKEFFEKINSLESTLSYEDWKTAKSEVDALDHVYHEKVWKLQLLGDESEYEGMFQSLERIKAAIDQQDATQALVELATIRGILEGIYSL